MSLSQNKPRFGDLKEILRNQAFSKNCHNLVVFIKYLLTYNTTHFTNKNKVSGEPKI